jgi:Gas vesicle synthesis protein GvpL/GvpF
MDSNVDVAAAIPSPGLTSALSEKALYVYAVARNLGDIPAELAGLGSATLAAVHHRALSAVASRVSLDEFGEDPLRRNMENVGWLEQVARCHDHVVQGIAGLYASVPMRLATICLDEQRVRALLDEWYEPLQHAIDRVEGREEWSLKVFAIRHEGGRQIRKDSSARPGAGIDYLRLRKAMLEQSEADAAATDKAADQIHKAVSDYAVAARRLAPQDPRLTGHRTPMVLNAAYLVDRDRNEGLQDIVTVLAEGLSSVRIELRGPWPPYSFSTLEVP